MAQSLHGYAQQGLTILTIFLLVFMHVSGIRRHR